MEEIAGDLCVGVRRIACPTRAEQVRFSQLRRLGFVLIVP